MRSLHYFLKTLHYDLGQHPPLIVVDPAQMFVAQPALPEDYPVSLSTLAEAAHMRVVSAGHFNALVPSTLWRITAKPGKANPFDGMKRGELVKLLLASLTAAQWETIGCTRGFGSRAKSARVDAYSVYTTVGIAEFISLSNATRDLNHLSQQVAVNKK